jgi:hypothetical protein
MYPNPRRYLQAFDRKNLFWLRETTELMLDELKFPDTESLRIYLALINAELARRTEP